MAQVKAFSLGGIGSPCCCKGGSGGYPCGACTFPTTNLTLTWILAGSFTTVCTMVYNSAVPTWTTALCLDSGGFGTGGTFVLTCVSNVPCLKVTGTAGPGSTCTNCVGGAFAGMTLTSYTCPPLNIQFAVSAGSACSTAIFDAQSVTFTITP